MVCVMGHLQTRKNTNKQEKHLSSKGYLPIKCKSLQVVGISGQLIQLAKAYGEKKVIKYQKEEEGVCQNTIETL